MKSDKVKKTTYKKQNKIKKISHIQAYEDALK